MATDLSAAVIQARPDCLGTGQGPVTAKHAAELVGVLADALASAASRME
jgi:hypothetical protein